MAFNRIKVFDGSLSAGMLRLPKVAQRARAGGCSGAVAALDPYLACVSGRERAALDTTGDGEDAARSSDEGVAHGLARAGCGWSC